MSDQNITPPVVIAPGSAVNGAGVLTKGTLTLGTASNAVTVSGTQTQIKSADGGAYFVVDNGVVGINSGVLRLLNGLSGNTLISTTAPTVTSAGTSPSISSSNGSATFAVNVGTGGTATTIVLAMPAATTGWNAIAENITGTAANRADARMVVQSSTTTSLTLQYQTVSTGVAKAFTASDIVSVIAFAY